MSSADDTPAPDGAAETPRPPRVDAGPQTQSAAHAKAGGTYAPGDFSPAAQRSRDHTTADGVELDSDLQPPRLQPNPPAE